MATAKNVTVIPATRNLHTSVPITSKAKRKVAGYARVSTDSDEQFTSYEAQVDYYTNYIKSRPEWEFVEVYTDEGISALNTKKRDGLCRTRLALSLLWSTRLILTIYRPIFCPENRAFIIYTLYIWSKSAMGNKRCDMGAPRKMLFPLKNIGASGQIEKT